MKKVAVILSTGERTEGFCKHLLTQQVKDVVVVKGLNRAEAIREAWKKGLEGDVLIVISADCLIFPGVVDKLVKGLGDNDRVSGWCIDKFRGRELGGVICYNSKFLPKALAEWKNYKDNMRPESSLVKAVGKYKILDVDTALHEYEMDYREIYDKYAFTKKKYPAVMSFVNKFEKMAKEDEDYKAVLLALKELPFTMDTKPRMKTFAQLKKQYKL
jgi:hypothetical protein